MLSYLQIGFDLELYDEQEYLMIYWYALKKLASNELKVYGQHSCQ
jgi:hypothetical protein